MRVFGLIGLVVVLAVIGLALKKQLAGVAPATVTPPAANAVPAADLRTQSQQMQQQIKQQLDATLNQPRPMPDGP